MSLPVLADVRVGIVGLGYVGLPLAVYLARHFPVVGFDIDRDRVAELSRGLDRTREVTEEEFAQAAHIAFSADVDRLRRGEFLHRHRSHAGRSSQASRSERAGRREPCGRQRAQLLATS